MDFTVRCFVWRMNGAGNQVGDGGGKAAGNRRMMWKRREPGGARISLAAGVVWQVLAVFVAEPFRELWWFFLITVVLAATGILLAKTRPQRVGAVALLILSAGAVAGSLSMRVSGG